MTRTRCYIGCTFFCHLTKMALAYTSLALTTCGITIKNISENSRINRPHISHPVKRPRFTKTPLLRAALRHIFSSLQALVQLCLGMFSVLSLKKNKHLPFVAYYHHKPLKKPFFHIGTITAQ